MLHPSYSDLMKVVNSEVEQGEAPVVNSRYSIVMATSKRPGRLSAVMSLWWAVWARNLCPWRWRN